MARLIVLSGSEEKEFALGTAGDVDTLGRSADSTIALSDLKTSSKHARILRTPEGGYAFQDLGSLNGSCIDGKTSRSSSRGRC